MSTRLLRLPEVKRRTGLSRSSVYLKMKARQFPKSIQIGPRMTAWLEADVEAWIEAQVSASRVEIWTPDKVYGACNSTVPAARIRNSERSIIFEHRIGTPSRL